MWQAEPPNIPDANPPAIYVAANTSPSANRVPNKLGLCQTVFNESEGIMPTLDASQYMGKYLNKTMEFDVDSLPSGARVLRNDTQVRILKQPQHGELVQQGTEGLSQFKYSYIPHRTNWDGLYKDTFVIEVSAARETVAIYYTMWLQVGAPATFIDENGLRRNHGTENCPRGYQWKISSK